LIAQLMLQPADVLLLDEPTNDLDIPTLEVLEESLLEYRGALVLVTHDRYMLDRVSTVVFGLDGMGGAERFADYSQWEAWQRSQIASGKSNRSVETQSPAISANGPKSSLTKKKLSYKETRELETIEQRIADAERELQAKHDIFQDLAIASDAVRLRVASMEMDAAQKTIDHLYARWVELEQKGK
jgi:ATP-binding cassette subfamily F protein uup